VNTLARQFLDPFRGRVDNAPVPTRPSSRLGLVLLAACAFASCRHDEPFVWVQDLADPPPAPSTEYVVAPGDVLNIRVWNQDSMSGRVKVRSDGKISLHFLNDVAAAGFKPRVLAQQIQVRLKEFLNNPVVTVVLEEMKPLAVSLLGEVAKPGQYGLEPGQGAGVLQALAFAGGLTDYAHRDRIFVLREIDGKPTRIRFDYVTLTHATTAASAFRLQNGDVVFVE
jgi:polysaccharide export outer membrane protein